MKFLQKYLKLEINEIAKPFFVFSLLIILFHFTLHPLRLFTMPTSMFYMDETLTLSSLFTTITFFLIGFLFLVNARSIKENSTRLINQLTGIIFILLSFDEVFSAHEYLSTFIKDAISYDEVINAPISFSWILPLIFIVLLVVIHFIRLIKIEKNSNAKLAYKLGILSFIAVVILEILGGNSYGHSYYVYFVGLEEGLEMIGASFFLLGITQKLEFKSKD